MSVTDNKIRDNNGRFVKGNPYAARKGEVRNPEGRPLKDLCITSQVKELLEQDAGKGKTHAQLVALAIVTLAEDRFFKGNVAAIKELLDRVEGKVKDIHQIEGDIPVNIVYELVEKGDRDE